MCNTARYVASTFRSSHHYHRGAGNLLDGCGKLATSIEYESLDFKQCISLMHNIKVTKKSFTRGCWAKKKYYVYLKNRSPTKVVFGATPEEKWSGSKINLGKSSSVNIYDHEKQPFGVEKYATKFIKLKKKYQGFWVTWINNEICVGHSHSGVPFIEYYPKRFEAELMRYIIFDKGVNVTTKWKFEMPPNVFETPAPVAINGGELRWVPRDDNSFPADALIGGFENEPLYILQAVDGSTKCPGKHVPSKNFGFIAMDNLRATYNYMILCGYDADWVETSGENIPKNAFVGGSSNNGEEPLYIGRVVHDGHLINGKVKDLQCIIPYCDDVFAYKKDYEILVLPNGLGDVGSNPA